MSVYLMSVLAAASENQQSTFAKTKAQISCAVTAVDQRNKCNPSSFYIRKFKLLYIVYVCTCRFASDPEDQFARIAAHLVQMMQLNDHRLGNRFSLGFVSVASQIDF